MQRTYLPLLLIAVLLIAPGCYHATVVTDRQPSSQVIDNPWAHSFINGLVPPATVDTAQECPNGAARIETQLSFLNMLAGGITFGLYTPMSISVTCAASATAGLMPMPDVEFDGIKIPQDATEADINRAFHMAAVQATQVNQPVAVRFVR